MRKTEKIQQTYRTKRGKALLGHTVHTSLKYKLWIAFLLLIIIIGGYAYYRQLTLGLVVTAMRDYTSWGIYISNFVLVLLASLADFFLTQMLQLSDLGG